MEHVVAVHVAKCRPKNKSRPAAREASLRTKRNGSIAAAILTFLILAMAIRSCIPPEVTSWHKQSRPQHRVAHNLRVESRSNSASTATSERTVKSNRTRGTDGTDVSRDHDAPMSAETTEAQRGIRPAGTATATTGVRRGVSPEAPAGAATATTGVQGGVRPAAVVRRGVPPAAPGGAGEGGRRAPDDVVPPAVSPRRRLKTMEYKVAPDDLKKLHRTKTMEYRDPRSTTSRKAMPLTSYRLNPLAKPDGYPWHRWAKPTDGSYPLDSAKFVEVLSRLGRGEDELGTVTPNNYTVGGVPLTPDVVRLGTKVRPYIIRGGTVLRPGGRTGMFVTLVQRAVEMASLLTEDSPRTKLLAEGELPLIFDANDYPWCGDDLVPVFRLNAIKDAGECRHSWPAMSLTYFQDPTNVQLTESPYEWDDMMAGWDAKYPWRTKIPKAVWRGRITGYTHRDGERPRQEMVRYARDRLDVLDVKPSTKKSRMDQDDFQRYMAIIDIDGNAWSARLGKLLCFNSVVIKVEPTYVGYWEVSGHF